MAVFNEIDEGGLNSILTSRLGMPGGSPAPSLAPEIMPQMVLENDRPEWGFPKGEMRVAAYFSVPAVVGQVGIMQLYNPPTSNSLCTIDFLQNIGPGDLFVVRAATSVFVAGGTQEYGGVADLRFRFRTHQLQCTYVYNAVYPANQGRLTHLTGNPHDFNGSIVLPPDSLVLVHAQAANTLLDFNVRWYERVAQRGELV